MVLGIIVFIFFISNGIISNLLFKSIEHPWKRLSISDVSKSDAIVVLSGGRHKPPGNAGIIEWNDPDRFISGIKLYKANKANKLIFTGGFNPFKKNIPLEGNIYIQEALLLGIPKNDLHTTTFVMNTSQEAKAIKEKLNSIFLQKKIRIILVTSAFHMNRAKRIFEKEGLLVNPYPVDFKTSDDTMTTLYKNPLNLIPSSSSLDLSSRAIREILGKLFYGLFKY